MLIYNSFEVLDCLLIP